MNPLILNCPTQHLAGLTDLGVNFFVQRPIAKDMLPKYWKLLTFVSCVLSTVIFGSTSLAFGYSRGRISVLCQERKEGFSSGCVEAPCVFKCQRSERALQAGPDATSRAWTACENTQAKKRWNRTSTQPCFIPVCYLSRTSSKFWLFCERQMLHFKSLTIALPHCYIIQPSRSQQKITTREICCSQYQSLSFLYCTHS